MALAVEPADVAAYAPGAPAVSDTQIEEALDWAEPLLERAGIVLLLNTRQERAARRAVMNYALAVASDGKASASRVQVTPAATKKIKVGKIEVEKAAAPDVQAAATNLSTSADEYRARAWQALYDAGVPRPAPAVGASR